MKSPRTFSAGNIRFGGDAPLFLIAGPCVIESEAHAMSMAERLGEITSELGIPYIFKASYDKANRSSLDVLSVGRDWRKACASSRKSRNALAYRF